MSKILAAIKRLQGKKDARKKAEQKDNEELRALSAKIPQEEKDAIVKDEDAKILKAEADLKNLKAERKNKLADVGIETTNNKSASGGSSSWTFGFSFSPKNVTYTIGRVGIDKKFTQALPITIDITKHAKGKKKGKEKSRRSYITFEHRKSFLTDARLFYGISGKTDVSNHNYLWTETLRYKLLNLNKDIEIISQKGEPITSSSR